MIEKFDFVKTMKDWRRMCKHYSDESMKDGKHSCVDMCPLGHNTACGIIENALDSDIEDMANAIAQWVDEHLEPVYETWYEFLRRNGIIPDVLEDCGDFYKTVGRWLVRTRIERDMAERLGAQSKEG